MTVGLGGLPAVSSRWRFGWLFAAPHRIAFAAAATMLGGSGLWWALVVIARSRGADLHWALPESTALLASPRVTPRPGLGLAQPRRLDPRRWVRSSRFSLRLDTAADRATAPQGTG